MKVEKCMSSLDMLKLLLILRRPGGHFLYFGFILSLLVKFRLHVPNVSNSAFVLLVCLTASCLPVAHPSGLQCAADPY